MTFKGTSRTSRGVVESPTSPAERPSGRTGGPTSPGRSGQSGFPPLVRTRGGPSSPWPANSRGPAPAPGRSWLAGVVRILNREPPLLRGCHGSGRGDASRGRPRARRKRARRATWGARRSGELEPYAPVGVRLPHRGAPGRRPGVPSSRGRGGVLAERRELSLVPSLGRALPTRSRRARARGRARLFPRAGRPAAPPRASPSPSGPVRWGRRRVALSGKGRPPARGPLSPRVRLGRTGRPLGSARGDVAEPAHTRDHGRRLRRSPSGRASRGEPPPQGS